MTVKQMREALRSGKRLRIVVGPGANDPTVILSLDHEMVMCESVAGWSAGVVEPACALASDFLETYLRHDVVEVIDGPYRTEDGKVLRGDEVVLDTGQELLPQILAARLNRREVTVDELYAIWDHCGYPRPGSEASP